MLSAKVQQLGDASVLHYRGRIVAGEDYAILRDTAMSQGHARLLVLDLAEVESIDAGGLGVLLGLREWAQASEVSFKLMNVMKRIEQILELTALDRVFEFCSVREGFCLLHRATLAVPWRLGQPNPAMQTAVAMTNNCSQ
ncbi:MAG TPA: STAS domain-containing protein [Candidatus Angelobacter sp.]|jgi:anti-anti-sigma factor|nr:STAS domain-containing protein [Candidatus Angelobacter sp.]